MTREFSGAIHRYARDNGVPWVDFVKGQRKDDVAHEYLARFTGTEGVLFVGRAQEKATVFRTEKRRNRGTGACQAFCVSAPSPFFEPPVCCLLSYRIAGPMSSLPGK